MYVNKCAHCPSGTLELRVDDETGPEMVCINCARSASPTRRDPRPARKRELCSGEGTWPVSGSAQRMANHQTRGYCGTCYLIVRVSKQGLIAQHKEPQSPEIQQAKFMEWREKNP